MLYFEKLTYSLSEVLFICFTETVICYLLFVIFVIK